MLIIYVSASFNYSNYREKKKYKNIRKKVYAKPSSSSLTSDDHFQDL